MNHYDIYDRVMKDYNFTEEDREGALYNIGKGMFYVVLGFFGAAFLFWFLVISFFMLEMLIAVIMGVK